MTLSPDLAIPLLFILDAAFGFAVLLFVRGGTKERDE